MQCSAEPALRTHPDPYNTTELTAGSHMHTGSINQHRRSTRSKSLYRPRLPTDTRGTYELPTIVSALLSHMHGGRRHHAVQCFTWCLTTCGPTVIPGLASG